MNTSTKWYEICVVKMKLDSTLDKIDQMFNDISDDCKFKVIKCGIGNCSNVDHTNVDGVKDIPCQFDGCPIVEDGIDYLEAQIKGIAK